MKRNKLLARIKFATSILSISFCLAVSTIHSQTAASPRQEKLLNGLKLIMFDVPTSDKVTLKLRIHAGSAFDPQGKEGVMKLLAADIFPNPETKEYFADELDGSLNVESNYDFIQINASAKPDKLLTMLETVSAAISNLTIDKEMTAKLKAAQLKRVGEISKDPAYLADLAASARLLGSFPYGRPDEGTAASLEKIDFADLISARQRFLTADNATMVVSGKFDPSLAYRAIRRYFGSWLKSDKLVPSTFRQPDDPPTDSLLIDSPAADRFELRFVTRGTTRSGADSTAYSILARILESRLQSLVPGQSVKVRSIAHILPGVFTISVSGTGEARSRNLNPTELLAKLFGSSIGDPEFQAAQQSYIAEVEKNDLADRWLDMDTFKTGDRKTARTFADVERVFVKLREQPFVTVIVSPPKSSN